MPTQKKDQKQYPNLKNQPGYKGNSDRVGMNSNSDDSRAGTRATGRERDQDVNMSSPKSSGSQSRSSQSRSSDSHHR